MKTSYLVLGIFLIFAVLFTSSNAYRVDDWMIAPIADNNRASYLFGEVICPKERCNNGDTLVFDLTQFKGKVEFSLFTLDIFLVDGTPVMKHDKPIAVENDKVVFTMKFDTQESYDEKSELDFLVVAHHKGVSKDAVGNLYNFHMTYTPKGSQTAVIDVSYDWEVVRGAAEGQTALQLPIHKGKETDGIIHDFYFSIDKIRSETGLIRVELLGPGAFKIFEEEACQINDVEVDVILEENSSGKIIYIDTDGEIFSEGAFVVTDCLRIQYAAPSADVAGLPVNFAIHLLDDKKKVKSATVLPAKFLPAEQVPDLSSNIFPDSHGLSCYFGIVFDDNKVVHKDDFVTLTVYGIKDGVDKEKALIRVGTADKVYQSSKVQSKDNVYENIRVEMPDSEKKGNNWFGAAFYIPVDLKKYTDKDQITCRFRYSHFDGNERIVFDDSISSERYHDLSEKADFTHTLVKDTKNKFTFSYNFEKTGPTPFSQLRFMAPLAEYVYAGNFKTCTINGKVVKKAVEEISGKDTSDAASTLVVTPAEDIPAGSSFKFECPDAHLVLPNADNQKALYGRQFITVYANGIYKDDEGEEQEGQWVSSHFFYPHPDHKDGDNDDEKKTKSKTLVYILIVVAVVAVAAAIAFFVVRRKRTAERQQEGMGVGLLDDAA